METNVHAEGRWRVLEVELPVSAGGWALNRKDLKLLQTIGKGEFGGEATISGYFDVPEPSPS